MEAHHPDVHLDLQGYDVGHKESLHFYLSCQKTLRLKTRKLRACLCEMMLPPVIMLALVAGWAASNDKEYAAGDYCTPVVNYTEMVGGAVCTVGYTPAQQAAAPYLAACGSDECAESLWPTNQTASGPQLCARQSNNGTRAAFTGVYAEMMDVTHNNTAVPPLDVLIAMQSIATYAAGAPPDDSSIGYDLSLRKNGNLEFVMGQGCTCEQAVAVIAHFNTISKLFNSIYSDAVRDDAACPGVWQSEDKAVDHARGAAAETTLGLVVLGKVDFENRDFDFTIRLNYSSTPYTSVKGMDNWALGLGKHRSKQYVYSGFSTLQHVLSTYFVQGAQTGWQDITTFPMPTLEYTNYAFLRGASSSVELALALAFLYPMSALVSGIVEEKEQRLREGMLIMGLSKRAFYLSWYASYMLLLTVPAMVLVGLGLATFLPHTSFALLFCLLELWVATLVAQSLLFSVFFSKARIAGIAAPLLGFMMILPRWALEDAASGPMIAGSLSSTIAYAFGLDLVFDYEAQGRGSSFDDFTRNDGYSYATCFGMLALDLVLYLFLFWYLDNVLPSQYGVKRHPLFLFSPSYWCGVKQGRHPKSTETLPRMLPHCVDTEMDDAARKHLDQREAVRIMGLRLDFEAPDGNGRQVAVDSLGAGMPPGAPGGGDALCFYEGQVQCVLGHNGAGKTSLINMLTGMYAPTGGDCAVWGRSIVDEMDEVRSSIGLCPQHNILWARMSCEEHLMFYGRLKGVPTEVLRQRVADMLKLVSLFDKKDAWSEVLSGGQKRKLSVACALIGGSRLIFLDEPTAGMDVESRRAMWRLLRDPAVLRGRVIVLTTHYMEEADVLGDSVAIMHKGCLHSWGSPFFLKSRLGVGYNMCVTLQRESNPDAVEDFVRQHLPRADVTRLSCTGTELRLRIPTHSHPDDAAMQVAKTRLNVRPGATVSKIREAVERLLEVHGSQGEGVQSDSLVADCKQVLSSMRTVAGFPELFDALEKQKAGLQIEGAGVSVTTLEEVFMRIEKESAEEEAQEQEMRQSLTSANSIVGVVPDSTAKIHPQGTFGQDTNRHSVTVQHDFGELYTVTDSQHPPESGTDLFVSQFNAMFMKRFRCARRDKRTLCCQYVFPVVMIILALAFQVNNFVDQPSLSLDSGLFHHPVVPYAVPAPMEGDMSAGWNGYSLRNLTAVGVDTACGVSEWAGDHRVHEDDAQPFGIGYDAGVAAMLANESYFHALPTAMRGLQNARLLAEGGAGLVVKNHPLPISDWAQVISDSSSAGIFSVLVLIPFSFLPSNFVSFVVKEKQTRAKHVQVVSGAHLGAYWGSTFAFDYTSYLTTVILAMIVFLVAGRDELVGSGSAFGASLLLFMLYGVAASWSSYALGHFYDSHTSAQTFVLGFNFFAGFVTVTMVQVLLFVEGTEDVAKVLQFIFRVIPSFALGDGLLQLSLVKVYASLDGTAEKSPFDMEVAGYDLLYLGLLSPLFFVVTLVLEWPGLRATVREFIRREDPSAAPLLTSQHQREESDAFASGEYKTLDADSGDVMHRRGPWLMCHDTHTGKTYFFNERTGHTQWGTQGTPFHRDEAVQAHAREVCVGDGRPDDFITVQGMRKVWAPRGNAAEKVAVADVSFGVRRGELFAFLGTNGAGKTTTLSMLTGEVPPTQGRALIAGHDVEREAQLARQNVGYCPQFDALLDNLTCDEHLDLYARLRGIPAQYRQASADLLLEGLGLAVHRKKLASKLSGGNRRKLSVAVAMIGGPAAVLLDEPSAGMDPLARRSLWGALEKAITDLKLSVILTTHHLEEVEGLSRLDHRVTIMVDGRLHCLGDLSHLKQQLGDTYELTVKAESVEAEARVRKYVRTQWPHAELVEATQQRLSFQVPKRDASLAALFRAVEDNRGDLGISDYSINETSLEQVFIRISEHAVRDEEVAAYGSNGTALEPVPPQH